MASISYDARERRLVFDGLCWPDDADRLADPIGAFAEPDSSLVVDLTRIPYLPTDVARAIGTACHAAEQRGCRVRVWTDPATSTAGSLAAAGADLTDPASASAAVV